MNLLLSSWSLPSATALAAHARRRGWSVFSLGEKWPQRLIGASVFYGSTLDAIEVSSRYDLALLEPTLDLMARLPRDLLLREARFSTWEEERQRTGARFIKPADPLVRPFDAGVYRGPSHVEERGRVPNRTPVFVSEPVEWLAEYRCFVVNQRVVATSAYLNLGRPMNHRCNTGGNAAPGIVLGVCARLFESAMLPPALVVDVGLIEDRGWAIVEFNPVWCSNHLSADAGMALFAIERGCVDRASLSRADRVWDWRSSHRGA